MTKLLFLRRYHHWLQLRSLSALQGAPHRSARAFKWKMLLSFYTGWKNELDIHHTHTCPYRYMYTRERGEISSPKWVRNWKGGKAWKKVGLKLRMVKWLSWFGLTIHLQEISFSVLDFRKAEYREW